MQIHLRGEIKFPERTWVVFDQFAPLAMYQPRVPLGTTGFEFAISIDPHRHKAWPTNPGDFENPENFRGLRVTGLYIALFLDVAEDLALAAKAGEPHPDLRSLGERIAESLETVHDSIIEFARHDGGQYWLPRRNSPSAPLHQRLLHYETRVQADDGWRIISIDDHEEVILEIHAQRGINSERWQGFIEQVRERGAFRTHHPHRRLLANAMWHFSGNDFRAAIIEAVAAWEMIITAAGARILARSASAYSVADWAKHIEKAGLMASSALLFALTTNGLVAKEAAAVSSAMEIRNNVIHNGQQKLNEANVKAALFAIRRAILAFEEELDV